jgi:hypothetical protein
MVSCYLTYCNDCIEQKRKDKADLAQSKPELCLSEERDGPDVQAKVQDDENRDEDSGVNAIVPVLDDSVENVDFEANEGCLAEGICSVEVSAPTQSASEDDFHRTNSYSQPPCHRIRPQSDRRI